MTHHPRPQRGLLALLVTMPLLLLAACGGDDEASPPGDPEGTIDRPVEAGGGELADKEAESEDAESKDDEWACDLLSDEAVGEATGYQVLSKEGDAMQLAVCEWLLEAPDPDEGVGMPPMLSLVVLPDEGEWEARAGGQDPSDLYQDVDGIGEKAKLAYVELPVGGQMAQLIVWDGDQGIYLSPSSVIWDGKEAAQTSLVDLAQMALDRL